jgi:hypothetical protein
MPLNTPPKEPDLKRPASSTISYCVESDRSIRVLKDGLPSLIN